VSSGTRSGENIWSEMLTPGASQNARCSRSTSNCRRLSSAVHRCVMQNGARTTAYMLPCVVFGRVVARGSPLLVECPSCCHTPVRADADGNVCGARYAAVAQGGRPRLAGSPASGTKATLSKRDEPYSTMANHGLGRRNNATARGRQPVYVLQTPPMR